MKAMTHAQAERVASMLSCLAESASMGHASECKASGGETRDPEQCQLCLDLTTADEVLTEIEWEG